MTYYEFILTNIFIIAFFTSIYLKFSSFITNFCKISSKFSLIISMAVYFVLFTILSITSFSYNSSIEKTIDSFTGNGMIRSTIAKDPSFHSLTAEEKEHYERKFDNDILDLISKIAKHKYRFKAYYILVQPCPSFVFRMHKYTNITEEQLKENDVILSQKNSQIRKNWRKKKNILTFDLVKDSKFKFINFYTNENCDNMHVFKLNNSLHNNIKGINIASIPEELDKGARWIIKDEIKKQYYVFTQVATQFEKISIQANKTNFTYEVVDSLKQIKDVNFLELITKYNIDI